MNQDQLEIPIQPVERPILCNPYAEPDAHWVYDTETGEANQATGQARLRGIGTKRNIQEANNFKCASFKKSSGLICQLVNALRDDVRRWRAANYRNATKVTRELLRHWDARRQGTPPLFLPTRGGRNDHIHRRNP